MPVAEQGFPDFDVKAWFGLAAPKGTPPDIVAALNRQINAALAKPDVKDRLAKMGMDTAEPMTPAQARDFVRREIDQWAVVVKVAYISRHEVRSGPGIFTARRATRAGSPMLDHPHPVDAPDRFAVHDEIGDAENAGWIAASTCRFSAFLAWSVSISRRAPGLNTEVFGLLGDVVGPRDILTAHPQAARKILRQRFCEAGRAPSARERTERGERIDSGETMIAERHLKIFGESNRVMFQIRTFERRFRQRLEPHHLEDGDADQNGLPLDLPIKSRGETLNLNGPEIGEGRYGVEI